jgi:hypothetical protein
MARLDAAAVNPMFLVAEGTHDGYLPGLHRRVIVHAAATGWLVLDDVRPPDATADTDVYWHFAPEWHVHRHDDTTLLAVHRGGARAWLVHEAAATRLACGGDRLGWYSPRYGALVPACSARLRLAGGTGRPFATLIGNDPFATPPRIESKALDTTPGAVAVRVRDERGTTLTLLRPGVMPPSRLVDVDGVVTDARVLQLRSAGSRFSVSLADATRVSGTALPFALHADAPVRDLHIAIDDGVARCWSSAPAQPIRLTWRAGAALRVVQPNGMPTAGTELLPSAVGA